MTLYELTRFAHIALGALVLASFWGAAWASKGSAKHRRIGRFYLLVMALLLAVTLVMATGMAATGDSKRAMFNFYITLISVGSVWMAWRSIEDRDNVDRYRGWACRFFIVLLGVYAVFLVVVVVPKIPVVAIQVMVLGFAALGLTICGTLLWRLVRGADHPRWWLSDHLTAMALNFGATHANFAVLALGSAMPVLKEPAIRTAVILGSMLAALLVRLWAGRRFLHRSLPSLPSLPVIAARRKPEGST